MNKRNRYDNEFKVQAVKLALEIGQSKACRELNLPENTLYSWLRSYRNGKLELGSGKSPQACSLTKDDKLKEVCKRNNALEKEVKRLREEVEFLVEACSFFAASRRKSAKA